MASINPPNEDAITPEEISGTAVSASASASPQSPARKRNAFLELMSSKRKEAPSSPSTSSVSKRNEHSSTSFLGRDGLGVYIAHPEKYPASSVIYSNEHFVAITDLYPKSSIHCLLLPRSPKHSLQHPFKAFEDAEFLAQVREEVPKLKQLVAKELQRRFGKYSKQDKDREAVLNGEIEAEELPRGRDWEKEVLVGIHAHPSMNHLHIHVLSRDRYSESLKHRKHWNSFETPFFVPLEAFPLAEDDVRRHPGREGYLNMDMKCWRCGRNFGNKFARLKEHITEEFEAWKRE